MALRGDVSVPCFGLTPDSYDRLTKETTHIIHAAANVKMTLPLEAARASAVTSVQSILALAESCKSYGVLSKVDIVSTVGVAGRTAGLVPERPMPEVKRFHNTYEAAKAEAEKVVLAQWRKGLPITLHRPSMVVGDARTGKIMHFQVFYHLCEFLSGRPTCGLVLRAQDAVLDIIPVDYVVRAIHWANVHPDTAGHIFHLCSGPEDAIAIPTLMAKVRDFMRASGISLPRLYPIPLTVFRTLLPVMALLTPPRVRRALYTLPLFLDYLAEPQTFANVETQKLLTPTGIRVPPVDTYLETILTYYHQARSVSSMNTLASVEA